MAIAPTRPKMAPPPSSMGGSYWGSVLIVDGEPSAVEAMAEMLRPHCRITTGVNGKDALRLAEACAPDLILLDLNLPDLDGKEVCEALQARETMSETPIVIVTQHGDPATQEEAFRAGATDFIVKPVNPAMIRTRVRKLIESRKRLRHTLQLGDARWRFALEGTEFGMWEWDLEGGKMLASPALCKMVGLPMTDHTLTPEDWLGWVHPTDKANVEAHLQALVDEGEAAGDLEYRLGTLDGGLVWVKERARVLQRQKGAPTRIMALISDTTHRRVSEQRIIKLSRHDPITELPNRKSCLELIKEELEIQRDGGRSCLMRVDLSGLARVNNALSRAAGDQLLLQAAKRFKSFDPQLRGVCQFGGKEFALIFRLQDTEGCQEQIIRLGADLQRAMGLPFFIHDEQVACASHIGVVALKRDGSDPEEQLRRAEVALGDAKRQKKPLSLFAEEMLERIAERSRLMSDLEQAVFTEQIHLVYQPIVSGNGTVIGAEALARWNHPERGAIRPDQFIPLAEESDLIIPMGAKLRRVVCDQLSVWSQHESTKHLKVSVNVSPAEFMASGFVKDVALLVKNGRFDPSRLQIELTESLLMSNFDDIARSMNDLRELGIGFALDDFGTGYSSLSYLKRLPFQRLKVDRAFVRDILSSQVDLSLARTIIAMGHNLGLEIVSEGVEDHSQVRLLSEMGCSLFQGYLFGRPMPVKDLEARTQIQPKTAGPRSLNASKPRDSLLPPSSRDARVDLSASILMIDDDRMTLELMRNILGEYSNVRMTTDPILGRQMAIDAPPDLLILDRAMDELEGIELWEELRTHAALVDTPVIFVTAYEDPEAEVRAFSAGASDFVTKPLSAARLRVAVGNQLQRKRLTETLKRQASIDPLTGVANRRSFTRALAREVARAKKTNTSLALIMLDLDFFKSINDELGHPVGDQVLEAMGQLLQDTVALPTELAARYGGEEFSILMPLATERETEQRANEILQTVRGANLQDAFGLSRPLTVSVGWSSFNPRTDTHEFDLVDAADQALLRAKGAGRDCVVGPKLDSLIPIKASIA